MLNSVIKKTKGFAQITSADMSYNASAANVEPFCPKSDSDSLTKRTATERSAVGTGSACVGPVIEANPLVFIYRAVLF